MRITLITVGSRGDVQPYVALACGLQAVGHAVTLATHGEFEGLARERGVPFHALAGDPRAILGSEQGQSFMASGGNPVRFMRHLLEVARPAVRQLCTDAMAACRGADLVLYSVLGFVGYHIAEALGIPALAAYLQPMTPTRAFPSAAFSALPRLGGLFNLATHRAMEQLAWQPVRAVLNEWRTQELGLPPVPFGGPFRPLEREGRLHLYGYSAHVVPKPADWPVWAVPTGYWFLDRHPDWQPPAELVDFLAAGSKPVYIGFGSMMNRDPAAATALALNALQQAGQRGLLATGWGGLAQRDLPDTVCKLEAAPHDWLFPQVAAVVHHGGAGTTAAALRAGVPSVAIPFFADQPFWAWRVAKLGAGPQPIPRRQLTAGRLAAAIRRAVGDTAMHQRAAALGAAIRAEHGVGNAVTALHDYLHWPRPVASAAAVPARRVR